MLLHNQLIISDAPGLAVSNSVLIVVSSFSYLTAFSQDNNRCNCSHFYRLISFQSIVPKIPFCKDETLSAILHTIRSFYVGEISKRCFHLL